MRITFEYLDNEEEQVKSTISKIETINFKPFLKKEEIKNLKYPNKISLDYHIIGIDGDHEGFFK